MEFLSQKVKEQGLMEEVHSIYNFIFNYPKTIVSLIAASSAIQSKISRFHFIYGQYSQFNILPFTSSNGPIHSAEANERNPLEEVLY